MQYYAIWYGMAGYNAGFDNTFNDLIKVWVEGDGEGQEIPDPNDASVATFFDPQTQRTYRAVKHNNKKLFSVGYEMVKRAASLQERIDNPTADDDVPYVQILLNYQRELLDLVRGMHEIYGKLIF